MSFFSSPDLPTPLPTPHDKLYPITKTHQSIDLFVDSLLKSSSDRDESLKLNILQAVLAISKKQMDLVVTNTIQYIRANKIDLDHRVQLLKIVYSVCEENRSLMSSELAVFTINFACAEMICSKENRSEWQVASCNILVALGYVFHNELMNALMNVFQAGVIPHYYIIKCLSDFCAANPISFVTRLREVMAKILPILGACKEEAYRWVVSNAIGRFGDALSHTSANSTLDISQFSVDLDATFDVLYNNWINSKDLKCRLSVIEAIGLISPHLTNGFFQVNLVKVLNILTNLYKISSTPTEITVSLSFVITTACIKCPEILETQLQLLMNILHPMAGNQLDYSQPNTVKNLNEILRVFQILLQKYTDVVLAFILNKLPSKENNLRIASFVILRHLVSSCDAELSDKKEYLLSSLALVRSENTTRGKKAVVALIVSLAEGGYLEGSGGESMISFLVLQAATDKDLIERESREKKIEDDTLRQLQSSSEHVLNVLASKVPSAKPILFPFILEYFSPIEFAGAFSAISRSLSSLIKEDDHLEFEKNPNLPKPFFILARLLLGAVFPFDRRFGMYSIPCLRVISPLLDRSLTSAAEHIPALEDFLTEHNENSLPTTKWEEVLLKLVKEYTSVLSESSLVSLCDSLLLCSQNFAGFSQSPGNYKRMAYRFVGVTLSVLKGREYVKSKIDFIVDNINFKDEFDRYSVAQGCALAARTHFDLVLEKIGNLTKSIENSAKSTGFFGLGGSKEAENADYQRAFIALTVGFMSAYCVPDAVVARAAMHILAPISTFMEKVAKLSATPPGSQSYILKESLIKALDLVGKSLHNSRLNKPFLVPARNTYLEGVLHFISVDPKGEHKVLGLNCVSTLILLDPPLSEELAKVVVNSLSNLLEDKPSEYSELVISNLNSVYTSILHMKPNVKTLTLILQKLEISMVSANSLHRSRACQSYLVVLNKIIEKLTENPSKEAGLSGALISTLIPRCFDAQADIRVCAVECIQSLLYITQLWSTGTNQGPSQEIKLFTGLRRDLETALVLETRLTYARSLASLLVPLVTSDYAALILRSLTGMTDPDLDAAKGLIKTVESLFALGNYSSCVASDSQVGDAVKALINELLKGGLIVMSVVLSPSVINMALEAFLVLVEKHFNVVIEYILSQPPNVILNKFLVTIASKQQNVVGLLNACLTSINDSPFSEEKQNPGNSKNATLALGQILPLASTANIIAEFYPAIFSSLLLRVGSASGDATSSDDIISVLLTFLHTFEVDFVATINEKEISDYMRTSSYEVGITKLMENICAVKPTLMRPLFEYLLPFATRNFVGHRSVTSTIFSVFITISASDMPLLRKSIVTLLPRVADLHPRVRTSSLIGIGNLVEVWNSEVALQASSILSALMTSMEDSNDAVASQGVQSANNVVKVIDEQTMHVMLVNICFRMRVTFDRSEASIRSWACTLFGSLTRFGTGISKENFMDQVHVNLPILILHMNDESEQVKIAAGETLLLVSKLLGVEDLIKCVENYNASPYDYDSFCTALGPILVREYFDHIHAYLQSCVLYFRSNWPIIRANSAFLSANILMNIEKDDRKRVDISSVCHALLLLMNPKEQTIYVRSKVAKSMSLLSNV